MRIQEHFGVIHGGSAVNVITSNGSSCSTSTKCIGKGAHLKALFQIKNTESGKVVAGLVFEDKQEAKKKRRELNESTKEGKEVLKHVVTLGPDHNKYNTSNEVKPVIRQPRRRQKREEEVEIA